MGELLLMIKRSLTEMTNEREDSTNGTDGVTLRLRRKQGKARNTG